MNKLLDRIDIIVSEIECLRWEIIYQRVKDIVSEVKLNVDELNIVYTNYNGTTLHETITHDKNNNKYTLATEDKYIESLDMDDILTHIIKNKQ